MIIPKAEIWRAIRAHCLDCVGTYKLIEECEGPNEDPCHLHLYRFGLKTKRTTNRKLKTGFSKNDLRKAVVQGCKSCLGSAVWECSSPNCNLYTVRAATRAHYAKGHSSCGVSATQNDFTPPRVENPSEDSNVEI